MKKFFHKIGLLFHKHKWETLAKEEIVLKMKVPVSEYLLLKEKPSKTGVGILMWCTKCGEEKAYVILLNERVEVEVEYMKMVLKVPTEQVITKRL